MEAHISSDSDDWNSVGFDQADVQVIEDEPGELFEKLPNHKFDPSQFEVISDEDEDRPLEFDIHCDKFLAAPSEHIAPLFPDIPLHDGENFRELTEEASCRAQFVPKCNMITAEQIRKVWETQGREGLETLHYIGCLQKLTDFSALIGPEQFEVMKVFPVREWVSWHAIPPKTLLDILIHHRFSDRLMPVTKASQLTNVLCHDGWQAHKEAWQLFDRPFINVIGQSAKETEFFLDFMEFKRRFPTLNKGKFSGTEAQMVPRWANRMYVVMEEFIKVKAIGACAHLIDQLMVAFKRLQAIPAQEGKHREKTISALLLAKSSILLAPELFFAACDAQLDPKTKFKAAKQLKAEIERGGDPGISVMASLRKLKDLYEEQKEELLIREQLAQLYVKVALRKVKEPLKGDFYRDFIVFGMRPEMSPYELEQLKLMIKDEFEELFKQENLSDSSEESSSDDAPIQHQQQRQQRNVMRRIPERVKLWLQSTWLTGSSEGYVFVCELLGRSLKSSKVVEELIVELAMKDDDFIEAGLIYLSNPRQAFRLIIHDEPEGDASIQIENVPHEGIMDLPLRDLRFFGPSFALLTDPSNINIHYHYFEVKYLNEAAFDGGGPRRNWMNKMMLAFSDGKRHFLKEFEAYKVPELFVHAQVFLGLGRLIAKGMVHDAGLPFTFHPDFSLLLKHTDKQRLKRLFKKWYQAELEQIKSIRSMADLEDGLEEVELMGVIGREFWKLADQNCGATVALPIAEIVERGCPVPVGEDAETGQTVYMDLGQFMKETGQVDQTKAIQDLSVKVEPFTFKPKTMEEVEEYVSTALELAWVHFVDCINSFLAGLNLFMDTSMFKHLQDSVLLEVFSPVQQVDLESFLAAFKYYQEEGRRVAVVEPSKIPDRCKSFLIEPEQQDDDDDPFRMSLSNAFACGVISLTPTELNGLIGQLIGSRSTGYGKFKPNHFKVYFTQKPVKNPLIPSRFCPAVPGSEAAKRFPYTASCSKKISIPAYATLEEIVMAVHMIATAPDEFPLR